MGEEDGIPFFTMERIRGCTLAQALVALAGRAPESLRGSDLQAVVARAAGLEGAPPAAELYAGSWTEVAQRIALAVARALAHAHERGVVHRDVKPSNVALTPEGRVLLFDFGLTHDADAERVTRSGLQIGTLYYMSPEQVRGQGDLDGRSDVYALGVTLYELLTLQLPYREDDSLATQRRILDGRPDSIRPRNRRVGAELQTVCLVAMDLERSRRYPDAEALARDLSNLLERRPIEARPPGAGVRLRRWIQRQPALASALVLGAALLVGVPVALWIQQSRYADELEGMLRELELAVEAKQAALEDAAAAASASERTLEFVLRMFTRAAPEVARGATLTARDVLELGLATVEGELADLPLARARIHLVIGQVLTGLGDYREAVDQLERGCAILRTADAEVDPYHLGLGLRWLGKAHHELGQPEEAEACVREALSILASVDGIDPAELVAVWTLQGNVALRQDRHPEAERCFREAMAIGEAREAPADRELALLSAGFASILIGQRRYQDAADFALPAVAALRDLLELPHPEMVKALGVQALALRWLGRLEEARASNEEAVEMARVLWKDGGDVEAGLRLNLAQVLYLSGDPVGEVEHLETALSIFRRVLPPESDRVILAMSNLAAALGRLGRLEEAEELYADLIPLQREVLGEEHPLLGFSLLNRGEFLVMQGRPEAAEEALAGGVAVLRSHPTQIVGVIRGLMGRAGALADLARASEGEECIREAVALAESTGSADTLQRALVAAATFFDGCGMPEEAERCRDRLRE